MLTPITFSTKAFKSGSKRPRESAAHCDSLFIMKAEEGVQIYFTDFCPLTSDF